MIPKTISLPVTLLLVAASTPSQPANVVENYSLEASSFLDALLKISAQFQLPMGVEWVKSPDTLRPIHFSRPRTTMTEILQAVVSAPAGYDWRMEDGVVHVFEHNLREDTRNPLNVVIKSFDEQPETIGWANNNLHQMVDQVVRHPEQSGMSGSVLGYPGEPVYNFAARNVPARSILDKIVLAGLSASPGMSRIWIATFPDPPAFTRVGFLEVIPTLPADQNQPYWNLRRWGQ